MQKFNNLNGCEGLVCLYLIDLRMYLSVLSRGDHVIPQEFGYCQARIITASGLLSEQLEKCSYKFLEFFVDTCIKNKTIPTLEFFSKCLDEFELPVKDIEEDDSAEPVSEEVDSNGLVS